MNERISKHFTLAQLTAINIKGAKKIRVPARPPSQSIICHLRVLCQYFLEPLCEDDYIPLIRCAYLDPMTNDDIIERERDWHTKGSAVDITCDGLPHAVNLFDKIHKRFLYQGVGYDELYIFIRGKMVWLHIGFNYSCHPCQQTGNLNELQHRIYKYNYKKNRYE